MSTEQGCLFKGCTKPIKAKGLCDGHYQQHKKGRHLTPLKYKASRYQGCSFSGCQEPHFAKGWCQGHYRQSVRTGEVNELGSSGVRRLSLRMNSVGELHCKTCERYLPTDYFYKHSGQYDGYSFQCKECQRARTYGLTFDQFQDLFRKSQGRCAICGDTDPKGKGVWHIDHDHSCCPVRSRSCGRCVRDILCSDCNTGIGLFLDDPGRLKAAIAYLESHGKVSGTAPRDS